MVAVLSETAAQAGVDVFSQRTRELLDEEVLRISEEAHEDVLALLHQERARLDALAEALLDRETLDEDEAYAAARVDRTLEPVA